MQIPRQSSSNSDLRLRRMKGEQLGIKNQAINRSLRTMVGLMSGRMVCWRPSFVCR
jgi:hypothetical protein